MSEGSSVEVEPRVKMLVQSLGNFVPKVSLCKLSELRTPRLYGPTVSLINKFYALP